MQVVTMSLRSARLTSLARRFAPGALLFGALAACQVPDPGEGDAPPAPQEPVAPPRSSTSHDYDPSSVLVRFRPEVGEHSVRARSAALAGAAFADRDSDGRPDAFSAIDPQGNLMRLELSKSTTVEAALEVLRADPAVLYAEPSYLVKAAATPDDPLFSQLWGLHNTGQTGGTADADIDAPLAWDTTTGSRSVVVGVVDTGIDYAHPDLAANLWVNTGETAGNGLDDDGNGVIDDVHGFNAISGGGDAADDNDHGSHCAGTIGAVGSNALGVTGVAQRVSLMSLKFLSAGGSGSTADAIETLDYAVARRNAGVNLRVLNNSWGGGGFSQALLDAINATNAAGILFVTVSGGSASNNDVTPTYPCNYDAPNVVCVTATDHNNLRGSFASYGATTVDLGAPGVGILSTTVGGTYAAFTGTSMAAPHVVGTAALMLSVAPGLTVPALKSTLLATGDTLPTLVGATVSGKRVNAAAAVAAVAAPQPVPPSSDFAFSVAGLAASFTDASSDADGVIVARAWSFGDGATSTATNPTHTYAASGIYTVTLTVTDDDGLTAMRTRSVTVTAPRITLAIERVTRNRARLEFAVDLTWSGASGVQVELWRNGVIVDLPDNDGAQRDAFRRYETSFVWRLCELRSPACSNQVSVDVGSADAATATVTTSSPSGAVTRVVPIVDEL